MTATLSRARERQQADDLAAAEALCRAEIARDTAAAGAALALLALCLFMQNRRTDALAALVHARAITPNDAAWMSDLGAALLLKGEMTPARQLLEQATADPAADAIAFNRLGTARVALGDLPGAEQAFREASQRRPEWAAAYNNIAGAQMRQLRPREALANYDRALALDPGNIRFDDSRNTALVALGRGDEALSRLEDELAAQPDSAVLHRRLAEVHIAWDQDREAEAHLRAAMRLDAADEELPLRLADLLVRGNRPEAAREILEAVVARSAAPVNALTSSIHVNALTSSIHVNALTMLAAVYAELGLLPRAEEAVARAFAVEPDALAGYVARAQIAMQKENFAAAEADLRKAIAQYPDAVEPWLVLGETLMCLGRIDEAIECYNHVAQISPGALAALADAHALPQDAAVIERMTSLAESPIAARPVRSALCFALCKLFDRKGEYDRAFRYAELANRAERMGIDYSAVRQRAAIDRIMNIFTPKLFARLKGCGAPSSRPIFVCGMPRSGTTLVEQIIAAHDEVHGAGELGAMPRIAAHLHHWLGTAVAYPLCMDMFTAETAEHAAAHYLSVIDRIDGEARHVVDKLPHNFMYLGLIALLFPNARIVHLERHPGDVALSNYFINFKQKRGLMGYALDLNDTAAMIRDHDRLMAHWRRVLPVPIYDISYEALVADFETETKALYDFLGLDWRGDVRKFHALDRPVRTGSVWEVRQPLYTSSVGRWRDYEEQLAHIEGLLASARRSA